MGVPIFDTLFSMIRRYLERRPIFSPDRGHIHHRLLDMGLTHRRAVLTIYAASAVFSIAAIAASFGKAWQVGVALLASSAVLFALVRAAGYIEYLRHHMRGRGRIYTQRTEAIRRALPDFADRLASAAEESQIRQALEELGRVLAFDHVMLVERGSGSRAKGRPRHWLGPGRDDETLETSFTVGPREQATTEVLFAWSAGEGAATPAMDVLLEVLVDFVERALVRIGSPLGPSLVPPAPPSRALSPSARSSRGAVSPSSLGN
jgi:UDP-GlcNAc:undecaprenyl-phosphate GlcNAc-1-phosphate transferase